MREAINLAASLADQTDSSLEITDAVLQRMYFWAHSIGVGPRQRSLLHDLLSVRTPSMAGIGELAFFDASGNPVERSGPPLTPDIQANERRAFTWHATHSSLDPFVGVPDSPGASASSAITLSRRFNDRRGRFGGMVFATIGIASLVPWYDVVDVGRDGIVSLMLTDGTIIVRKPDASSPVGGKRVNIRINPRVRMSAPGTVLRSPIDGKMRIAAFHRVNRFPLIVVVGFGVSEAFAEWRFFSILGFLGAFAIIATNLVLARGLIAELRRTALAQVRLSHDASMDGLTGVFNRREFDAAIGREWRQSRRDGSAVALLMIDVDLFKTYNDRYGHQRGDDALRQVAACLRRHCARPRDIVARYGGEEFAVLLPSTPADGAKALAEDVRLAVAECRIEHVDSPYGTVTLSIGLAEMTPDADNAPADIIRRADAALYAAKRGGRNRVIAAADTGSLAPLL